VRRSPLYFDLTISFSKSISLFHASLGENARPARQAGNQPGAAYWSELVTEVDQMIWQAVHAGFAYFQRQAGYTRTGSHASRVDGRETGQWREAELAVAHWLQHTSRDDDMQLHVHSQIAHVARTVADGKWRAPDSHPGQQIEPLRSAEPEPVTGSQARELNLVPGQPIPEVGQWIKDIAAAHSAFAEKLAQRQACAIRREEPGFGLLGQLHLAWISPNEEAILQPPKPQIPPSARVLERARERDVQMEAIDYLPSGE
jgi:TrwC relaxase